MRRFWVFLFAMLLLCPVNGGASEIEFDYVQISYEIRDRLSQLEERYRNDMTEAQKYASAVIYDRIDLLNGEENWQLLLYDLENCHSAERFSEIIAGKYTGITEAKAGLPGRAQVERAIVPLYEYINCPPEPLYTAFMPFPMFGAYDPCWFAVIGNNNRSIHVHLGSDLRPLTIFTGVEYANMDRLLTKKEKLELSEWIDEFFSLWGLAYLERSGDAVIHDTALSAGEGTMLGAVSVPMRFTDGSSASESVCSFFLIGLRELKIYEYHALSEPDYLRNAISIAP